jgi:hypothetical protein
MKLRDSLLAWYRRIDALEPGRVIVGLPDTGIEPKWRALGPRKVRSGAALFDQLVADLERP